ncbi:MAG TPA: DUF4232 domain-containing protein [Solirubrobacteraceae bacterium]|nr:DUF4232 domain-containing protein [Solirubrobacteraceae bacterium]
MGTFLSRCAGPTLTVLTATSVAACGSGGSTSSSHSVSRTSAASPSTSSQVPTSPQASTPAQTSTSQQASTSAQASAASVPGGCTPAHTAVSFGQAGAGTGHAGLTLLFRNSGSAACTLTGYPGAALVAATGRRGQLQVARTPQGYMGGLSPGARANPVVVLAPGRFASAILEGLDFNPVTTGACPAYSSLLVTPPNQRVTVRVARSLSICDPTVHPVVSGTAGRQAS